MFKNYLRYFLLLSILLSGLFTFSQEYPKDYFRSPLDIPIVLSGNFGELRSNHFHSGLDMKTEGVEGKKVYAIADGYVSRIKVSGTGYGKALYITHPNGYVSVYAHLRNYNDIIGKYIKTEQYKQEQFEIELFPSPEELKVKKGDLIAFTGNTGGSGGPHLHFEIRDEKTEEALNPFLFGFAVQDQVKPSMYELTIYPLDETSSVNGSGIYKRFPLAPAGAAYKPSGEITLQGRIGFGINTNDQHSAAPNRVGVYNIELKVDGIRKYFHQMDRFSFDHTRCLNSHTDYNIYKRSKSWFHKLHVAPNNKLMIYKDLVNRGVLEFDKDTVHELEIIVKDFAGNTSKAQFFVKSKSPLTNPPIIQTAAKTNTAEFFYDKENQFKDDRISMVIPEGALYDHLKFEYRTSAARKDALTPTFHIHNEYTPVHIPYNLSIKVDSLSVEHMRKALVVHFDEKGNKTAIGGDLRNDRIFCTPKVFGTFTVMLDTVPPQITPLKLPKAGTPLYDIRFKITDNLSGIKSYRGTINDKWVLMEHDPKQALLYHVFEKDLPAGKHVFRLEVKDQRGNISEYTMDFVK
jgi:hypothetical protein